VGKRRVVAVVAATMTVLALSLAGCGERRVPYASLAEVPEKLAADGTTIVVGDQSAPVSVHLYEDPRCSFCEEFETTGGAAGLRAAMLRREAVAEYTLASFLDDRVGGNGSKRAVNALRAALEAGKFAEYHKVLYAHQPEEAVDGFTSAYLLDLAGKVDGLRSPAFDSAVKGMKYRAFVTASQKAYQRAGGTKQPEGPGTPTAVINDVRLPPQFTALIYDGDAFAGLLTVIRDEPDDWQDYEWPEVS
jgi:protein-disulfide isomerase